MGPWSIRVVEPEEEEEEEEGAEASVYRLQLKPCTRLTCPWWPEKRETLKRDTG